MRVNLGRRRQIEEAVAAELAFAIEFIEALGEAPVGFRVVVVASKVIRLVHKTLTFAFISPGAVLFGYGLRRYRPELVIAHGSASEPEQSKARCEASVSGEIIERRQQLPLGQIAGRAKHHHGAWFVGDFAIVTIHSCRFGDVNSCARAHRPSPNGSDGAVSATIPKRET